MTLSWRLLQRLAMVSLGGLLFTTSITPPAWAWRWDDDELENRDETEIQLDAYRKRVNDGISNQERVILLDRLLKLFQIHKRDTTELEKERAMLSADENAIQNVSVEARQKSQQLYQKSIDQIRLGQYKQALTILIEAEHLNPLDKALSETRQKMDGIAPIMPEAPTDPNAGDLVKRGIMQFVNNDPSKSINYLMYAQQKSPKDQSISGILDIVKRTFPNESSEILDARLNLIDQKLQRALEKIYSGEYLISAKECQEVLDLEPENALALTRLGSVYYAMGQVKQARTYWQQAQALDPKNDVLKSFLLQTQSETDRAPSQVLTYKVEKGDTLQRIAEKIFNDRTLWKKLFEANRSYLKNAYTLTEGQVLVVPQINTSGQR